MITIKQLITLAPYPPDVKQQLLEKAESFSPEKKFEVEETCWALISMEYQNKLQYEQQKAGLSAMTGAPSETPQVVEERILRELVQKLEEENTEEALTEVRKKLSETQQP